MNTSRPLLVLLAGLLAGPACNNSESRVRGVDAVHRTADEFDLFASWLPVRSDVRQPALLLLHQPGSGRDRHDFDEIFDTLYEAGFNLLVPDLRSHGQSAEIGDVDALATDPAGYPTDVLAWLNFLDDQAEEGLPIDADRIGVVGLGTSANLAAAAVGHGLAECAVAVSPELEQFNALQAGFPGAVDPGDDDDDDSAVGDDDDSAAEGGVVDGVNLRAIRWMAAESDQPSAADAATLHEATSDPKDLYTVPGSAHGVELMWESAENKTAIIEWCGQNL